MAVAFLGCTYNFNCLALNRYQAVLPDFRQSKGLSFLVDSRFNRSKQRTSMEMQGNGVPMTIDHSAVKIPHVLTVAGSYSGAGIQADLKTCAALGVYCSTVIIAVTAQNTVGVQVVNIVPEEFVAEQMKSVLSDTDVDVVKTGMLPSIGIIKILHRQLQEYPIRDSKKRLRVLGCNGGHDTEPSAMAEELLPMADIVTPNLKEASALLDGVKIKTVSDMRSAAKLLHDMGPRNVLVKGGDLPDSLDTVDVFFDGEYLYELRSSRIKPRNTHGTGCTLASCIAAELAKGSSMLEAVKAAKFFVETALDYSKDIFIGNGPQGPFDHLTRLKSNIHNSGRQVRFNPSDLFLYAVTDSRMNRKWGHSIVQLREKDIETGDFLEAAKSCLQICRAYGVPLLINDCIDVALASDADGVHIGQSDMPTHVARSLLGPRKIIAWFGGADYIGCGGVYPTNTKENNLTVGLDGPKTVYLASKLPVVAIGGINISNARPVMEMGVPNLKGVAVVSALFDRECVLTETRKLHAVLTEATAAAAVN
ncbi:thiamine biosynthetic bifunctional enzyme TH1 [Pyrus ussuriensis x Pyrus communis]|uniref:thiamine phosphate synthase n=1 Tax=Pyrus ussuriensis x Pyrus communis TaxID=2448454 RepID=A0A5N5HP29_9ROSA|nr:thiamine biosynthetic bifunctional enzyme TH1 [Pyrus ussuriensis x Pyrus communis]